MNLIMTPQAHTHKRYFKRTISRLASQALKKLPLDSPAYKEAKVRQNKPMDYLRCFEFPLAYAELKLAPGMRVLDLASPQWFSLCLAQEHPQVEFTYVNIMDEELEQIRNTAECLGIKNIRYAKEDCRALTYKDRSFDRVISISVIEHVAPDVGGDVDALKEVYRILKDDGELVISVPLKETASLVYDDKHPVWEKAVQKNNFYMRNYDLPQFERLARDTNFTIKNKVLMYERPGLFAMEYWEGGPGKHHKSKDRVIKLKKKIDKLIGLRLEGIVSDLYIKLDAGADHRPINIVAAFSKRAQGISC